MLKTTQCWTWPTYDKSPICPVGWKGQAARDRRAQRWRLAAQKTNTLHQNVSGFKSRSNIDKVETMASFSTLMDVFCWLCWCFMSSQIRICLCYYIKILNTQHAVSVLFHTMLRQKVWWSSGLAFMHMNPPFIGHDCHYFIYLIVPLLESWQRWLRHSPWGCVAYLHRRGRRGY